MKKGLIFKLLVIVTMLFSLVACNQEEPIVDVATIKGVPDKITVNYDGSKTVVKFDGVEQEGMTLQTLKVNAVVEPANASNPSLTFTSLAEDKFTISNNGEITFLTDGSLEDKHFYSSFTVASNMNKSVVKTCLITFNYEVPGKGSIKLKKVKTDENNINGTVIDLFTDAKTTSSTVNTFTPVISLNNEINMSNNYASLFDFISSKPGVAEVAPNGTVTAKSVGITTITVTSKIPYSAGKYASASYTVYVNPIRSNADLAAFLGTSDAKYAAIEPLKSVVNYKYEAFIAEEFTESPVSITVSGTKSLDLNGKEISTKQIAVKGTLKITGNGGTIKTNSAEISELFIVEKTGSLKIDGGTYEVNPSDTDDKKSKYGIYFNYEPYASTDIPTFEMKNAKLNVVSNGSAYGISNNVIGSFELGANNTVYAKGSDAVAISSNVAKTKIYAGNKITAVGTGTTTSYGIKCNELEITNSVIEITSNSTAYGISSGSGLVKATAVTATVTSHSSNNTSFGIAAGFVDVSNGTWNVSSDACGIIFSVGGDSSKFSNVVAAVTSTYDSKTVDANNCSVTITDGTYTAKSNTGSATAINTNKSEVVFKGTPVVKAIAKTNEKNAVAVNSSYGIKVNTEDPTKVATFEADGYNAIVFGLNWSNAENTINNVEATAKGANKAYVIESFDEYKNGSIINVVGGTYIAKGATDTRVFNIDSNKETSFVGVKAEATANSTGTAYALYVKNTKDVASSVVSKIGGNFSATGKTAYGIYLEDVNMAHAIDHKTSGILPKTTITATGSEACGLEVKLNSDYKGVALDINSGLSVTATGDQACGIAFDNKATYNNQFIVNWYGTNANVTADAETKANALANLNAQINIINDVDYSEFDGYFTAKVKSGVSLGLLNGIMTEPQNQNQFVAGQGAVLDSTKLGIINIDGPAYLEFSAKATTGYDKKSQANYVGTIGDEESSVYADNTDNVDSDCLYYDYIANGSVLTYSNEVIDLSNCKEFNIKETCGDKDPIVYRIPTGITWERFVKNGTLSHKVYGIVDGKVYVKELSDLTKSEYVYIASSENGKAVLSTDTINNEEYYYAKPIFVEYLNNGSMKTDTYYVEVGAKWSDYVEKDYAPFSIDDSRIVEGLTAGKNKAHIWDKNLTDGATPATPDPAYADKGAAIEAYRTYTLAIDFTICGINSEPILTVVKGSTWETFVDNSDYQLKMPNQYNSGSFAEGADTIYHSNVDSSTFISTEKSTYEVEKVAKTAEITAGGQYYIGMSFSIASYNESMKKTQTATYLMKNGSTWADFVKRENTKYDVDGSLIVEGLVCGKDQAHIWGKDEDTDEYIEKTNTIVAGETYQPAISFSVTNDGTTVQYTVARGTTWADFASATESTAYLSRVFVKPTGIAYESSTTGTEVLVNGTSSLFVTTANGEKVTRVAKNAKIEADTEYFVGMTFSIKSVNAVNPKNKTISTQNYDLKNGATWATFVTEFGGYSVDTIDVITDTTTTPSTVYNKIVVGEEQGPSHAHVWDTTKVGDPAADTGYVAEKTHIVAGREYVRAIDFTITDEDIYLQSSGLNTRQYKYTVLEGTTWSDFINEDILVASSSGENYIESTNSSDVYKKISGTSYSIVTEDVENNNKIEKVLKTKQIGAGAQYYVAVEFTVPYAEDGKATELNTYLMKKGATWADFAAKYNKLYAVDNAMTNGVTDAKKDYAIVNGSTNSGMQYMHIGTLNAENTRVVDLVYSKTSIDNGDYKLGVSADIMTSASDVAAAPLTVLPETTWETLAGAYVTAPTTDHYFVKAEPDNNVYYGTTTAYDYVAIGNDDGTGLEAVDRDNFITANKHYFVAIKFSIKLPEGLKTYYAIKGANWSSFASGVKYLTEETVVKTGDLTDTIAVDSLNGGAEELHVYDATVTIPGFVTIDTFIASKEYDVAFYVPVKVADKETKYVKVKYGSVITQNDIDVAYDATVVETGRTLKYTNQYDQEFKVSDTVVNDYVSLTAVYVPNEYKITYKSKYSEVSSYYSVDGGTLPETYTYGIGKTIPVMNEIIGSNEWCFAGWTETPWTGTMTSYSGNAGTYEISTSRASDILLYAVYGYTSNGGTTYIYYCANTI